MLRRGHNCCDIALAHRAAVVVDGEDYFATFVAAAERAQRSIIVLAWDFNSRMRLTYGVSDAPVELGDFLNWLVRRRRGLHIHVLDWDYPMIFGGDREFPPIYGLGWTPRRRVHLRYDNTHPLAGSHHQKIVVIDDRFAFAGGFDLTDKRWDSSCHDPLDPRRTAATGKPYPPFHDAMIAVDGPCAQALARIARGRWQRATGEVLAPVEVDSDPWPPRLAPQFERVQVGIACTAPASANAEGVREVETLYLDLIRAARHTIYIENQYFTAQRIGEALAARLQEPEGPEIVVVSRLLSHGWLEEMTMHVLRNRLIKLLKAADRNDRFRIFYPDVPGLAMTTCIDVHSKLMVVDDEWLRVGSSNISNRSMGLDSECDLVVEARGDPRTRAAIRSTRDRLLAEHMNVPPAIMSAAVDRAGSMAGAIEALSLTGRTLRPLELQADWSDTALGLASIGDMERPVSLEKMVDDFSPSIDERNIRPARRTILMFGIVVLVLALLWRFSPLSAAASIEAVLESMAAIDRFWWGPLVLILAYTPASIIMFPRPLITLAAVLAYGAWLGFTYAMGGILLAASANYLIGRLLKRDTVRRIAGARLNRLSDALRTRGLLAMTAVRIVPVAPFAMTSIVAGAIRIRMRHFLLGTFIGVLPGVLAATVFGRELMAAFARGYVNWWLVGGSAILLAAGALLMRRVLRAAVEERDHA